MSWEDCGFKPGKINGPAKCSRQCSACDGEHHFIVDASDCSEESPDAMKFACKHCDVTAEMVPDDTDPDDFQDPYPDEDPGCAKCGSGDTEWVQCEQCHGAGEHDLHEEDAVNYAEGEEYETCEECKGKGGWVECRECQRRARIEAQTLPLFDGQVQP